MTLIIWSGVGFVSCYSETVQPSSDMHSRISRFSRVGNEYCAAILHQAHALAALLFSDGRYARLPFPDGATRRASPGRPLQTRLPLGL